jgi:hypothetical protein
MVSIDKPLTESLLYSIALEGHWNHMNMLWP